MAGVGVAEILIVVLLAGAVLAAGLVVRPWRRPVAPRRGGRPKGWVRVACGVAGVALLVALAAGTMAAAGAACRVASTTGEVRLRAPARPDAAPASERARLLLHVVFALEMGGRYHPMEARDLEIPWPEERGRARRAHASVRGVRFDVSLAVERVRPSKDGAVATLSGEIRSRGILGRGTSSLHRALSLGRPLLLASQGIDLPGGLLSLRRERVGRACVIVAIERAAIDDPLRVVGAEGALEGLAPPPPRSSDRRRSAPGSGPAGADLRGLRWADEAGLGSVTLLLAAILLAQPFRRRSCALAGTLALAMLLGVALDRLALGTYAARLRDSGAGVRERIAAAAHLPESFFFRKSALAQAQAAAADPALPAPVRDAARLAALELSRAG